MRNAIAYALLFSILIPAWGEADAQTQTDYNSWPVLRIRSRVLAGAAY